MKSRKIQVMYITEVRSGAAELYTSSEWWLVYQLNSCLSQTFSFQKIASKTNLLNCSTIGLRQKNGFDAA